MLKMREYLVKQEQFKSESKTIYLIAPTRNRRTHPHLQYLSLYPHTISPPLSSHAIFVQIFFYLPPAPLRAFQWTFQSRFLLAPICHSNCSHHKYGRGLFLLKPHQCLSSHSYSEFGPLLVSTPFILHWVSFPARQSTL